LWANSKEVIAGKIREISPVADPATRTFIAKVSLQNLTPKQAVLVKLGMTASVQFVITTPGSFIKVPLTALYQEKGVTSVWLVEKNAVKLVPVQVGGVSGNDVLLTSGVTSGQTVVTAGVHILNPGQKVSILPPEPKAPTPEPYLTTQTLLNAPQQNAPQTTTAPSNAATAAVAPASSFSGAAK
jgi:RND family efflux transporter MFP subunit